MTEGGKVVEFQPSFVSYPTAELVKTVSFHFLWTILYHKYGFDHLNIPFPRNTKKPNCIFFILYCIFDKRVLETLFFVSSGKDTWSHINWLNSQKKVWHRDRFYKLVDLVWAWQTNFSRYIIVKLVCHAHSNSTHL